MWYFGDKPESLIKEIDIARSKINVAVRPPNPDSVPDVRVDFRKPTRTRSTCQRRTRLPHNAQNDTQPAARNTGVASDAQPGPSLPYPNQTPTSPYGAAGLRRQSISALSTTGRGQRPPTGYGRSRRRHSGVEAVPPGQASGDRRRGRSVPLPQTPDPVAKIGGSETAPPKVDQTAPKINVTVAPLPLPLPPTTGPKLPDPTETKPNVTVANPLPLPPTTGLKLSDPTETKPNVTVANPMPLPLPPTTGPKLSDPTETKPNAIVAEQAPVMISPAARPKVLDPTETRSIVAVVRVEHEYDPAGSRRSISAAAGRGPRQLAMPEPGAKAPDPEQTPPRRTDAKSSRPGNPAPVCRCAKLAAQGGRS